MPQHKLSDIVAESMNSAALADDEALEARLMKMKVGANLRSNGERRVETAAERIMADAKRAGEKADRRAASAAKIEESMVATEVFVDIPDAAGAGGNDDAAAGGDAPTEAVLAELDADNRGDKAEAKRVRFERTTADAAGKKKPKRGAPKSNEVESIDDAEDDEDGDGGGDDDEDADDASGDQKNDDDENADDGSVSHESADIDGEDEKVPTTRQPLKTNGKAPTVKKQQPPPPPPSSSLKKKNTTARATKKTKDDMSFVLTDPDEIAAINSTVQDGDFDANDVDEQIKFAAEHKNKKRRTKADTEKAASAGDAGAEEKAKAMKALKEKMKEYFEGGVSQSHEGYIRGYLTVVIADQLRGTPSKGDNAQSIYAMLRTATIRDEKLDVKQPLLGSTAEELRCDVTMLEAIISQLFDFVRSADADLFQLMLFTMLSGVEELVVVKPTGVEETDETPVLCSVLNQQLPMHKTKLVECKGYAGVGSERSVVERQYRMGKNLVPVFEALFKLNSFVEFVKRFAAERIKIGTMMAKLRKNQVSLVEATAALVNDSTLKSAFTQTKSLFKTSFEAVRMSATKFEEVRKEAAKMAKQLEEEAAEANGDADAEAGDGGAEGSGDSGAARPTGNGHAMAQDDAVESEELV